jgi:hypothetical protein
MALAAAGTSPPASPSIKYNNTLRRSRAKSRSIVPRSVSPSPINDRCSYEHRSFTRTNIGHFLFRTSVILCSEHPVFFRSEHLDGFHSEHPENDFMFYIRFRTSGYLTGCPEEQGRKRTNPLSRFIP